MLGVEDRRRLALALAVGVMLREVEGEAEGVRGAEADGLAEAQWDREGVGEGESCVAS